MSRWFFFLLSIGFGIAAGLFYGWVVKPVEYIETSPDSLRIDYKTDYVLMTAETYHAEGNLEMALRRLAVLGDSSPSDSIASALVFAAKTGYGEADIALMQNLADALQVISPTAEIPQP